MNNTPCPDCRYWVGRPAVPIGPQDAQWNADLPLDRQAARAPSPIAQPGEGAVTYGAYFSAARDWLLHDNLVILRRAAKHQLGCSPPTKAFHSIDIHLIKHGAFYHPAKVTSRAGDKGEVGLVLNVALSAEGRTLLRNEVANLIRLNQTFATEFVPRIYGSRSDPETMPTTAEMFAAQWLTGFCEFHLTHGPSWVLWDDRSGPSPLTELQIAQIYEQAAFILTHYYNPLTFEAIGNWHHAAGDFVVRPSGKKLDVRLISVRRYSPFLEPDHAAALSLEAILDGLCLFLLDMSLRMRVDRLDGTGRVACSPDGCVEALWHGFRRGLDSICNQHGLPPDFLQGVLEYIGAHSAQDLICLGRRVLARYPAQAEETVLLEGVLEEHVDALISAMAHPGQHVDLL